MSLPTLHDLHRPLGSTGLLVSPPAVGLRLGPGLVGQDGATHAGAFDVGFLANLPNMTVMAAGADAAFD